MTAICFISIRKIRRMKMPKGVGYGKKGRKLKVRKAAKATAKKRKVKKLLKKKK